MPNLTSRRDALQTRLDQLKAKLSECNGEAYRGCWLDTATNSAGKRYTRLRWFREVATKKKGCRILHGEELAIAMRAIALWQEVERVEVELKRLDQVSSSNGCPSVALWYASQS
ncbi:MAG: hypothetical protein OHK0037_35360 [Elainellaceae cyanobacterium]